MEREKIGALVLLLFSLVYGLMATQIPLSYLDRKEVFTPRTLPYVLAAINILLSVAIIILPTVDPKGKPRLADATRGMDWTAAISLVVLMLVYGMIIKWLGFILSSIGFLLAGFRILGERRYKLMVFSAVLLVAAFWCIMSPVLGVYIPPGEIFYLLGVF